LKFDLTLKQQKEGLKISLKKDDKKTIRVLSLGAGVQSSVLAYMYEEGFLENPPDFAVFADTQREPDAVYEYFKEVKKRITKFPIYLTTKGDLGKAPFKVPFFLKKEEGGVGMGWRQCTTDYKIRAVHQEVRNQLGLEKRKRWTHHVEMLLGISTDEKERCRLARDKWQTNIFPLIEIGFSREDCLQYLKDKGLPMAPKSSCYFCPYRNDKAWKQMKEQSPEDFKKACDYDKYLRSEEVLTMGKNKFKNHQYVHRSCVPLSEVKFKNVGKIDAYSLDDACDGLMCGL